MHYCNFIRVVSSLHWINAMSWNSGLILPFSRINLSYRIVSINWKSKLEKGELLLARESFKAAVGY